MLHPFRRQAKNHGFVAAERGSSHFVSLIGIFGWYFAVVVPSIEAAFRIARVFDVTLEQVFQYDGAV